MSKNAISIRFWHRQESKSDKATGTLTTPLHSLRLTNTQIWIQSTGFDYTRTKNPTRATAEEDFGSYRKCRLCFGDKLWNVNIVLASSIFPSWFKSLSRS